MAGDRGGCVVIAFVFLVLPAVGLAFVVLWLNGNVLGWQTERDLASFYGAVGRDDYAAAGRVMTATDEPAIFAWASIAAGQCRRHRSSWNMVRLRHASHAFEESSGRLVGDRERRGVFCLGLRP